MDGSGPKGSTLPSRVELYDDDMFLGWVILSKGVLRRHNLWDGSSTRQSEARVEK